MTPRANLTGSVDDTIHEPERERTPSHDLAKLRAFLLEMERQGLVIKKGYDLPPLDTIGKTAFRTDR